MSKLKTQQLARYLGVNLGAVEFLEQITQKILHSGQVKDIYPEINAQIASSLGDDYLKSYIKEIIVACYPGVYTLDQLELFYVNSCISNRILSQAVKNSPLIDMIEDPHTQEGVLTSQKFLGDFFESCVFIIEQMLSGKAARNFIFGHLYQYIKQEVVASNKKNAHHFLSDYCRRPSVNIHFKAIQGLRLPGGIETIAIEYDTAVTSHIYDINPDINKLTWLAEKDTNNAKSVNIKNIAFNMASYEVGLRNGIFFEEFDDEAGSKLIIPGVPRKKKPFSLFNIFKGKD